jgi:hypothetical protein
LGLDAILGKIADHMGESSNTLHDEIFRILSATSKTNGMHRAIVNFAIANKSFRIVTTNQDTLLEHEDLYPSMQKPPIFDAPALPEGDNFVGIVNLHGSIRNPQQMVFTDRDFGYAYLTKQYCARFLTELFSTFTVLFIGYSHDDPLMKYHARGLGACNRFILTDDVDSDKWKTLDITPVPYKKEAYSEIIDILNALASHTKLNPSERQALVSKIAVSDPQACSKYELSLIQEPLEKAEPFRTGMLYAFLKHAKDYRWCMFLETHEIFSSQRIFQKIFYDGKYDSVTQYLAEWFLAVCFMTEDEDAHAYGFTKLSENEWSWNHFFFDLVLQVVADKSIPCIVARKLGLLCANKLKGYQLLRGPREQAPGEFISRLDLGFHLSQIDIQEHRLLVIRILEKMTEPAVRIEKSWAPHFDATAEQFTTSLFFPVDDNHAEWELGEWWKQHIDHSEYYEELLGALSHNLEEYYKYLEDSNPEGSIDTVSYFIESLFSESLSNPRVRIVILIMRDILMRCDDFLRQIFLNRYRNSTYPLFIRLCIVALMKSKGLSSDDKINWLIFNKVLLSVKHNQNTDFEIYELLRSELPNASDHIENELAEYIQKRQGWIDSDGDEHTWEQYQLCCWIAEMRNDWRDVFNPLILKYKQKEYWAESLKPRARSVEFHPVPEASPVIEANDFITSLRNDPKAAVDGLFSIQTDHEKEWGVGNFDRYNSHYKTIYNAIEYDETIALKLWDIDYHKTVASKSETEIRLAVLEVLTNTANLQLFDDMLSRLLAFSKTDQIEDWQVNEILRYVHTVLNKNADRLHSEIIPLVSELCEIIWNRFNTNFVDQTDKKNLVFHSPSFWPCSLIDVILHILEIHNRESENKGIPDSVKHILDRAISSQNLSAQYAILRLFMSFRFVYWCNKNYAIKKLMPIIKSSVQKYSFSWYAWSGFLSHPECDDEMLSSGLYEALLKLQPAISQVFDAQTHIQYDNVLISILSYANIDSKKRVHTLHRISADTESSRELLQHANVYYANKETSDFDKAWNKWLKKYVSNRLSNRPVKIADAEFRAIIGLSFCSNNKFEEIVHTVINSKQKLNFNLPDLHPFYLTDSKISEFYANHAQTLTDLICFLLENHQGQPDYLFMRIISAVYVEANDKHKTEISHAADKSGVPYKWPGN